MKRISLILLSALLILAVVLPGCRERFVYTGPADWLLLVDNDPDEGTITYNAQSLYVDNDFTDGSLIFMAVTHDVLPDPPLDYVIFAVYLDTDQDAATGLSASAGWGADATPNTIGADFMLLVGAEYAEGDVRVHQDEVYTWDGAASGWNPTAVGTAQSVSRQANTDTVRGGVNLTDIGNPVGQINVVGILVCDIEGAAEYDHIPDAGYVTIDLDSGSVVQSAIAQSSSSGEGIVINRSPAKRVSLMTGKEIIFEEAR
jgi:hypothetical protein